MSRIPFLEVRFFDRRETRAALEERFELHLRCLRQQRRRSAIDPIAADTCGSTIAPQAPEGWQLGTKDHLKLHRRAKRILEGAFLSGPKALRSGPSEVHGKGHNADHRQGDTATCHISNAHAERAPRTEIARHQDRREAR